MYLIKLSGKTIDEFISQPAWVDHLQWLKSQGHPVILVHGAGTLITEWSKALGLESTFINGLRVTDDAMMDVVAAVQSGLINGRLVAALNHAGIKAVGLTGADHGLACATPVDANLGRVGTPVISGDLGWLRQLLTDGIIPVFSSTCLGTDGGLMNINADVMAGELGKALGTSRIFFLSDIPGVILNGTVQPVMNADLIGSGIESGQITNGMIPKLTSALDLVNNGVGAVWIGPGKPDVFIQAMQQVPGAGTWIMEGELK